MAASAALVFAGKSVATPAISFLINKAFSYIDEYFKSKDMDEVKNRLLQAMPQIQAVLDVVSPEHVRGQSSALDAWLWQLRDAVEAAEDAIDELEYYELEEKAKHQRVSDWGSPFGKMKHKFVKSVKSGPIFRKNNHGDSFKRLMKSVDGLDKAAAGVISFLNLTDHLSGGSSASSQQQVQKLVDNSRQTGSTLSATIFVGREKEKEQIAGWLANPSVESGETGVTMTKSIPIISVVGHGGMGKTTLAQSICEQEEVLKHFKVIWITVSTSFDATSVTSKILECATGIKPRSDHLEPLQRDLIEKLKSINFLLVLDDVWEDKRRDEWEKLFAPLRKLNTRSKILLTTRMQSVADMAAKVMGVKGDQCLTLQGLEEDKNLELFTHHAFSGFGPGDSIYLKLTGEQIAKKLRGCPLVTKVVGEHLQSNMSLEYWSRFLDQGLEHFRGTEDDIMKVLRLSYYHLPTKLQICFRYCCIFPQDYEFQKKELVQLWIGSGLISEPASDTQTLVNTAEHFLAQLTRKSFFDLKSVAIGWEQFEHYVMHDLMHELARNVSTGECARIDDPVQLNYEKDTLRHLCIVNIHSFSADEVKKISHFKNIRTIIIFSIYRNRRQVENDIAGALEMVIESSKSLRLLHSELWNTFCLADKLGNLKHLRYIYLHKISAGTICGVAKLYHLLVLQCGSGLETETYEVRYLGDLEGLRYVSYGVRGFGNFCISRLTSLQELHDYQVGGKICNKISGIRNFRDLRELSVGGLDNVNYEEAKDAKLKEKQLLNSLYLEWSTPDQIMTDDLVLDHLEPHVNIRKLLIRGYEGPTIPSWIENRSVKNLVSFTLIRCINWEYLPSLGEFVLLKNLVLFELPKLRQIGRSSGVSSSTSTELLLPQSLHTLQVSGCQNLRELPILPASLGYFSIQDVWLTKLPMIGKISSQGIESKSSNLTNIFVMGCPYLTSLKGSLLEQKLYMGALRVLRIEDCTQLESASIPFEEMKELELLTIYRCPKLRMLRDAKDMLMPPSLRELTIAFCGDMEVPLFGPGQLLTNLSDLKLENCSSLVSLPSADVFRSLGSLQYMYIEGCENLSSLGGLGSLPSRIRLSISECNKLAQAAESSLTRVTCGSGSGGEEEHLEPNSSLQIHSLNIDLPSLLLVEPLQSLCHTEDLRISNGSEMESLPERWLLQNRRSLQHVSIYADSLKSLPPSMQDLCTLEDLDLRGAGQLQSLPHLPSSLKKLDLSGCHPELEKKITEHGSPEWNKIAHVPFVRIGDMYFVMGKKSSQEAAFESLYRIGTK
ncbi:disease resistance protein RGA2-like [Lolium perenne]|uniref:disease resistance protein RGA2-like n=1 Tax=Lolium perenne TaxID=4522 RepID=UPI0021EA7910